jgi:hypothetical protein
MTYTIAIKPSNTPGKVTAASSNGYTFTTTTPLLDCARYWLNQGADPAATITTIWSSGPGHWSLRSTINQAAKLTVEEGQRGTPRFRNGSHSRAVRSQASLPARPANSLAGPLQHAVAASLPPAMGPQTG